MRSGAWFQLGSQTQTIAKEVLETDVGTGVIISPRDLDFKNAKQRAKLYRELGADVLIDHQFYDPSFEHKCFESYPTNDFRVSISKLSKLPDQMRANLASGCLGMSLDGLFSGLRCKKLREVG